MFDLFEPLMWMAGAWAMGLFTGLGIGVARTRDQMDRQWRGELMNEQMRGCIIDDLNTCAMYGDGTEIGGELKRLEDLSEVVAKSLER